MPDDLFAEVENAATTLDPVVWAVIAGVALLVLLAVVVLAGRRRQRRRRYEERFGSEYHRTASRLGSTSAAEEELDERAARRDRFALTTISPTRRQALRTRWDELQAGFVDAPASAVRSAEVLLDEAARERGYPDAETEQRLRDLALDHGPEVQAYRDALGTSDDHDGSGDDDASLRRRMVAGKALLDAILQAGRGADDEPTLDRLHADDGHDRPGSNGRHDATHVTSTGPRGSERDRPGPL